jgi:uncharacterized protein (DUF2236 family)
MPYVGSESDIGLFGPESVAWRIHGEPAALIGGLRALMLQALHPLAMAGVADHSDYRANPWDRLARTSEYLVRSIYGTKEEASAAAEAVRAIHRRVTGVEPITGLSYRADDPDLLAFVHHSSVQSFLVGHLRYVTELSRADQDRYVAEMAVLAEMLGTPSHLLARSRSQLDHLLSDGRPQVLQCTPAAREALGFIVSPPMPLWLKPAWLLVASAAIDLLPKWARDLYRIGWLAPAHALSRPAVSVLAKLAGFALPPHPMVARARAESVGRQAAA